MTEEQRQPEHASIDNRGGQALFGSEINVTDIEYHTGSILYLSKCFTDISHSQIL